MIVIDGTAYPLEPGRTYILVVNRDRVSVAGLEAVQHACQALDVRLVMFAVAGNPHEAVKFLTVEQPEVPS